MNMFDSNERQVLTGLLKRLGQPDPRFLASRWLIAAVWLVLFLFFIVFFQVVQRYQIGPMGVAIVSAVLGLLTAVVLLYSSSARQWSCIRKHLNEQSIRARLSELDGG
ncbi:hypothetical protein [Lysobacter sp. CA199]|uniref:hypothetical protein n=1 Tax=Lysobacter sp. CA199 TaxID=3455608 RepID=UPI003F8D88F2